MIDHEAPTDIVLELARKARLQHNETMDYVSRMNIAVWGEIAAYREIVGPSVNEQAAMKDGD
jgi:hypothetical protein